MKNKQLHKYTSKATDTAWGIDTVGLSYDVDLSLCDIDSPFWQSRSSKSLTESTHDVDTFVGQLPLPNGNVRVALYTLRGVCALHFNAARLTHGKSEQLLDARVLAPLVEAIIDELQHVVWPAFDIVDENGSVVRDPSWNQKMRVKRLDVARNFNVAHPELVKSGVRQIKSSHQKTMHEYANAQGGWTLENRTESSGSDRLYDKSAEIASQVTDERLWYENKVFRFEAQLQQDRLKKFGLNNLAGITEESVWDALASRWEATRWGSPLPGTSGLLEAVSHLSPTRQDNLLGYLQRRAAGVTEGMSAHYMRERDKLARSCGLIPGVATEAMGAPDRYLDLFQGAEVPFQSRSQAA